MGIQSAMSTALTGMTAAGTTIDVVGNNLANSSTVGFKASSALFATQFMQTMSLGSAPTANSGGTNPRQIGLGTMVADIAADFSQGTIEISSNATDFAIQGDGFFILQGGSGEQLYTRDGVFKLNSQSQLVTASGYRVLGFGIDENYEIQRTQLVPIEISLGGAAVAQATENVFLEGTLSPTGDLANTASVIQTGILGDGSYSAPTSAFDTNYSIPPNVAGWVTSGSSEPGGSLTPGDYRYRLVYANEPYDPLAANREGTPSEAVSVTLAPGDGHIDLQNIPNDPIGSYSFVRIYRTTSGGSDYCYVDEIPVGTTTYSDNTADADLGADLHRNLLNGNYSYYVTYADAPGGPGVGTESRPSPISGPINVANGRIELSNFPAAAPGSEWQVMRIYRNTATDDSTFYYLGEVGDVTGSVTLTDSTSDAEIMGNARLDMNGPRIIPSTRLVQVLSRDGSAYEQVFQEGTLLFAGTKGGRTLDVREFEITSASTVLELINFMEEAMGIQDPGDDPVNPIPPDSGTGANPGGTVSSDGRIVFVGNNGVDNAIDIKTAGMQLATAAGTQNINLSFATAQEAVGDGAVTDFIVYDSLGIPLRVRLTMVLENRSSTSTTYRWFADSADNDPATGSKIAVGTGQVTFDGEGNFISATQDNVAIDRRNISSRSPLEFELDFSSLSGLAAEVSTLAVTRQDGSAPGVLSSFIVGEDGTIRGVFSNGVTRNLGQIRLSRFANPAGLEQRGENTYAEGVNSGLAIIGDPGQQGIGTIVAGAVEQSNTDTGGNLIDLILASTMYRSNTRVITTAQEMIDELLAMRR